MTPDSSFAHRFWGRTFACDILQRGDVSGLHQVQMVTEENALRKRGADAAPARRIGAEMDESSFLQLRPGRSTTVLLPLGHDDTDARFDAVVADAPKAQAQTAVQECSVFIVPQVRGYARCNECRSASQAGVWAAH